jgi:acetolactate decarboxylase
LVFSIAADGSGGGIAVYGRVSPDGTDFAYGYKRRRCRDPPAEKRERELSGMVAFPRGGRNVIAGLLTALLLLAAPVQGWTQAPDSKDGLFQVSTLNALFRGVYDGAMTCGELKKHGDFGMGTLEGLDGEVIVLDGKVFQAKVDGNVLPVDDEALTPFAMVTFFSADANLSVENIDSIEALQAILEKTLPSRNLFYAFRIDGTFGYMKTRSVPKQEKPYRQVVQTVRETNDVRGTMVGFWCPGYARGFNVPGFHFHFISEDRRIGGHVLDCSLAAGTAQVKWLTEVNLVLPRTEVFWRAKLPD